MQFLPCAPIKAVCILQVFHSEGHQTQLLSGGCNAELWAHSQSCPLPCTLAAACSSGFSSALHPPVKLLPAWQEAEVLLGQKSWALLRLTVQQHRQEKTSLSCKSKQTQTWTNGANRCEGRRVLPELLVCWMKRKAGQWKSTHPSSNDREEELLFSKQRHLRLTHYFPGLISKAIS